MLYFGESHQYFGYSKALGLLNECPLLWLHSGNPVVIAAYSILKEQPTKQIETLLWITIRVYQSLHFLGWLLYGYELKPPVA